MLSSAMHTSRIDFGQEGVRFLVSDVVRETQLSELIRPTPVCFPNTIDIDNVVLSSRHLSNLISNLLDLFEILAPAIELALGYLVLHNLI